MSEEQVKVIPSHGKDINDIKDIYKHKGFRFASWHIQVYELGIDLIQRQSDSVQQSNNACSQYFVLMLSLTGQKCLSNTFGVIMIFFRVSLLDNGYGAQAAYKSFSYIVNI